MVIKFKKCHLAEIYHETGPKLMFLKLETPFITEHYHE